MVKGSNTRQQITFRKTELVKIKAEAQRRGLSLSKFINQLLREADVI